VGLNGTFSNHRAETPLDHLNRSTRPPSVVPVLSVDWIHADKAVWLAAIEHGIFI
jgi:hypothetical protein